MRHFFSVEANSKRLDAMEVVKQAATRKIADKHGVKSGDDIAELEKRLREIPTAVSSIKNEISDDQLKLKRVYDLITVYEKIVVENYIDNLIKVQREQGKVLDSFNLSK